jgi:hypothetical protein
MRRSDLIETGHHAIYDHHKKKRKVNTGTKYCCGNNDTKYTCLAEGIFTFGFQ